MDDSPEAVLAALDPEQREVALAARGPVCVIAGAGTGKTRAIAHRVAYAVRAGLVDPGHVLAVTFTTRAAGSERHLTLLGIERGEHRVRAVVHRAPPSPLSYSRIRPTCGEAQSRARCCICGTTLGEDRRRGCHSE